MTLSSYEWPGDDEPKPAPGPLLRVQALVNTVELPDGADRLRSLADARPWLVAEGLLAPSDDVTDEDLGLVRAVREALREMLVHNAGGPAPSVDALRTLRTLGADGPVRVDVDDHGAVLVQPVGSSLTAGLVGLLLTVGDAQRDGSWARLKACANDECHWAFYDRSRNHGGSWCEMSTCGNKLKNRDFRARRRADGTSAGRRADGAGRATSTGATPGRRPARPAR